MSGTPTDDDAMSANVVDAPPLADQGVLVSVVRGEASHTPHMGFVFIDWDAFAERWVLTHTRTCERVELPFGADQKPDLLFDCEGFAAVVLDDTEPELAEDLFKQQLFSTPDGGLNVIITECDGSVTNASLSALESLWKIASLRAPVGPLRAEAQVDFAVFDRPRFGCRCWWNVLSLHQVGGFVFKVKFPSIWLHKGLPGWVEMLTWLHAAGHVALSKRYKEDSSDSDNRLLPWVSVSSVGLLALLSAWSWGSKRRCGLQSEENQERARLLLAAFTLILDKAEFQLVLFADSEVRLQWPRPSCGRSPFRVVVVDGKFKVQDMLQRCRQAGGQEAHLFESALATSLGETGEFATLTDLMFGAWATSGSVVGRSLLSQVVHSLGEQIDGRLISDCKGQSEDVLPPGYSVTLEGLDLESDYKLDRYLHKYVMATSSHFEGQKFHSVCVDKSRVGTQALQVGAIVGPDNKAAWMVPQASFGAPGLPGLVLDPIQNRVWAGSGCQPKRGLPNSISISFLLWEVPKVREGCNFGPLYVQFAGRKKSISTPSRTGRAPWHRWHLGWGESALSPRFGDPFL